MMFHFTHLICHFEFNSEAQAGATTSVQTDTDAAYCKQCFAASAVGVYYHY